MVVDYFSDVSPVPLTPSNPLYQLYQYVIGYEVHLYLQAMDSALDSTARLILALDDEDRSAALPARFDNFSSGRRGWRPHSTMSRISWRWRRAACTAG